MSTFLALATAGIVSGCVYALTASGLVLTYTTSGVFNVAHGGIGMIAAFTYWDLTVSRGMPGLLALVLTVFVLAPLLGLVVERLMLRRLAGAPIEVSLTVTIGLLLLLIGTANTIWPPTTPHRVRAFFLGDQVTVLGVVLTVHQLIVIGSAVAVAGGLWAFLHLSRMGVTMRAVVDDRELTALSGASPARVGMLGFALGAALAALAGVLLASQVQLNAVTLTLVVINGYAAAVVGRLRSLPLTFLGALLLGLVQAMAVGYVTVDWLSQLQPVIPMVFLFVALIAMPHTRLRTPRPAMLSAPRVADARTAGGAALALVATAGIAAATLPHGQVDILTHGAAVALVLLSLVPLTGYGGQVSLCQLSFAGIGAVVMARADGGSGSWWALAAAIALPACVGALVALPTLRLRGLYLALATLAFAYAMEGAFFGNASVMTDSLSLRVPRPAVGLSLADDRTYLVAVSAVFALCGCGVLALRRSGLGRRLVALGDSPTGATTIGIRLGATKLAVFALSAGIAGLGGALLGGQQGAVSSTDFGLVLSLTLLLLAVIWGLKTVSGMLLAGLFLELGPQLQNALGQIENVVPLLVGLAAIGIGAHQNGLVGGVVARFSAKRVRSGSDPGGSTAAMLPEEVLAGAQS